MNEMVNLYSKVMIKTMRSSYHEDIISYKKTCQMFTDLHLTPAYFLTGSSNRKPVLFPGKKIHGQRIENIEKHGQYDTRDQKYNDQHQ